MKTLRINELTIAELTILAGNPNNFGSMTARVELNKRNKDEGLEPMYEKSRIDEDQLLRELTAYHISTEIEENTDKLLTSLM